MSKLSKAGQEQIQKSIKDAVEEAGLAVEKIAIPEKFHLARMGMTAETETVIGTAKEVEVKLITILFNDGEREYAVALEEETFLKSLALMQMEMLAEKSRRQADLLDELAGKIREETGAETTEVVRTNAPSKTTVH